MGSRIHRAVALSPRGIVLHWPDMQVTLKASFARLMFAGLAALNIAAPATPASAQVNPNMNPNGYPGGPPQPPPMQGPQGAPGYSGNPMCPRLEAQLSSIDRGGGTGDPARDDQIRRYQDAATRQQAELDRVTMQAKRMGCDSSGFFSLFSGQSSQCGPVNTQIQQMRANLDQINGSLTQLRGNSGDRDNQRRSVLMALAQNQCGPQYASMLQQQGGGPGGFLNNLFSGNNPNMPNADVGPQSGTYRTVCVRTCDGAYFPISFATVPQRFADDERTCKAECPATDAALYAYRNPGEDMNQAVSTSGAPYTALPNAFRYRQEFTPTCSCKAQGQSWTDALKNVDDKAIAEQQGDIIVTEESAKKMARPQAPPPPKTAAAKKGAPPPGSAAAAPPTDDVGGTTGVTPPPGDKSIRTVGPTFIPAR
jgi:hypothetical protein